jgi:hypothetical protein
LGTQSPKANLLVLDFNRDFSLRHVQPYTLVQNSWEVYIGHFVNPQHDGVLLYDRTMGEARLLSFNATLQLAHEQALHNLSGNWQVYSGDFSGSGQAQVVLYDPSSGNGQFLSFARDLSLAAQKSYSGWGTNQVLYVGHFGRPALSIMLYDPAAHQSTFLAFDASLQITRRVTCRAGISTGTSWSAPSWIARAALRRAIARLGTTFSYWTAGQASCSSTFSRSDGS